MGERTREPRVNVCGSRARGGAVLVDGVEAVLAEETGLAVLVDAVEVEVEKFVCDMSFVEKLL